MGNLSNAVAREPGTQPVTAVPSSAMPAKRMNRDEFFTKLAPLGEDGLAKVLWNLYWRAPAPVRDRIEAELDPAERDRRKREAAAPPDPELVLDEVQRVRRAGPRGRVYRR